MKRILNNVLACLTASLIIMSCKRDNSIEHLQQAKVYSDAQIISIYSQIGDLHNKGLDKVFNDLQMQFGTNLNLSNTEDTRQKMYSQINKSLVSFMSQELQARDIDFISMLKGINSVNNSKTYKENYLTKDLVKQLQIIKQPSSLSQNFWALTNQLNQLMDKNARKDEYDEFVKNNISKLTDFNEKIALVSSASTAYSSLLYWKDNATKWRSFFNSKKNTNIASRAQADGAGKTIAKADVSGIIQGAVGGCIYGAIGGTVTVPGVGTLAGCAAVGTGGAVFVGATRSAAAAVDSFVDWLFS